MPHYKVRGHSVAKLVENNVNSSAFLQNFLKGRLDINKGDIQHWLNFKF